MADTSVKFFHSEMPGAPTLNGLAGSLINVLNACLINGFGLKNVDTCTVTGGVAKLNISTGHSAVVGSVILVAGATPAALNGEQRVTATTTTSISFATSVTDQSATGAITVKQAPAGWVSPFVGTNIATYKSPDLAATGCVLRVDDTAKRYSRVVGYEAMTDINTGTGQFPTTAQRSGGSYWSKSSTADSVTRSWRLFADGGALYLCVSPSASYPMWCELVVFGDIVPAKSGDAYACVISGADSDMSTGSAQSYANGLYSAPALANIFTPRAYTGVSSSQQMVRRFTSLISNTDIYSGGDDVPFPNPADGGLYLTPFNIFDGADKTYRGYLPGLSAVPQKILDSTFVSGDIVNGTGNSVGRKLLAISMSYSNLSATAFIDVTGPWR